MSIFDIDLISGKSKLDKTIDLIRHFEPQEGYYLAFSGGKDSVVCKELLNMAGVKYDGHYAITTVDPPELIKFIKQYHQDIKRHAPEINMWDLIVKKKMPPTRIVRYCCSELKEEGGKGRFVVTGVRKAESAKRSKRKDVEFDVYGSKSVRAEQSRAEFNLMNDNDEKRRMIETCVIKGKNIINPIINWSDEDVWEFINYFQVPYCKLYDEGFKRLGCVGCPMGGRELQIIQFKRWPHIRKLYVNAFDRMIQERINNGLTCNWKTGEEVMEWWLSDQTEKKDIEGQLTFDDY